ncbi:acetyl esterase/lipase [Hoeflea marina]|uniref:Acetyl esterase/lipase n=1 Tax=Hoeflea marina TaxID=274592 RepID=A0A317PD97_9HYPH|nr:alpha/beta hydrolase [Hoeflea marina]PWV97519.1 acetyl esterase/lipase [Hoeflea marina]
MTQYPIRNHDDAYANGPYIPESELYPARWMKKAAAFRAHMEVEQKARLDLRYGDGPRNTLDLFLPGVVPRGLAVYVHGGYWRAFDKSSWSHLAAGALAHGYAVAMPQYTLCPENSVGGIGREVAAAVAFAAGEIDGPIRLSGHSAGGQLVTRLISGTPLLPGEVLGRIAGVVSISGVHDLRAMRLTGMNEVLRISPDEARAESPVLLEPLAAIPVTACVGLAERPEFVRQNRALYEMWRGFETPLRLMESAGLHHFNIIDGLEDPEHPLCRAFVGTDGWPASPDKASLPSPQEQTTTQL